MLKRSRGVGTSSMNCHFTTLVRCFGRYGGKPYPPCVIATSCRHYVRNVESWLQFAELVGRGFRSPTMEVRMGSKGVWNMEIVRMKECSMLSSNKARAVSQEIGVRREREMPLVQWPRVNTFCTSQKLFFLLLSTLNFMSLVNHEPSSLL